MEYLLGGHFQLACAVCDVCQFIARIIQVLSRIRRQQLMDSPVVEICEGLIIELENIPEQNVLRVASHGLFGMELSGIFIVNIGD